MQRWISSKIVYELHEDQDVPTKEVAESHSREAQDLNWEKTKVCGYFTIFLALSEKVVNHFLSHSDLDEYFTRETKLKASLESSSKTWESVMRVFEEAARLSLIEKRHVVRWELGL